MATFVVTVIVITCSMALGTGLGWLSWRGWSDLRVWTLGAGVFAAFGIGLMVVTKP